MPCCGMWDRQAAAPFKTKGNKSGKICPIHSKRARRDQRQPKTRRDLHQRGKCCTSLSSVASCKGSLASGVKTHRDNRFHLDVLDRSNERRETYKKKTRTLYDRLVDRALYLPPSRHRFPSSLPLTSTFPSRLHPQLRRKRFPRKQWPTFPAPSCSAAT